VSAISIATEAVKVRIREAIDSGSVSTDTFDDLHRVVFYDLR
jgi:hypothetical protein